MWGYWEHCLIPISRTVNGGRSYPLINLFKSKRHQRGRFAARHAETYSLNRCTLRAVYRSRKDAYPLLHPFDVLIQTPRASSDLYRVFVAVRA
jgi:hypothetical protein